MPDTSKPLSRKASRRLLFGLIVASLFLAFLAALGIKSATENEAFQKEVIEMRRLYDPNFEEDENTADSSSVFKPDSVTVN